MHKKVWKYPTSVYIANESYKYAKLQRVKWPKSNTQKSFYVEVDSNIYLSKFSNIVFYIIYIYIYNVKYNIKKSNIKMNINSEY